MKAETHSMKNQVIFMGNLAYEVEVKKGKYSTMANTVMMSTHESIDPDTGVVNKSTTVMPISAYGAIANQLASCDKGDLVEVKGCLSTYQSKKYKTDKGYPTQVATIRAFEVRVVSSKKVRDKLKQAA